MSLRLAIFKLYLLGKNALKFVQGLGKVTLHVVIDLLLGPDVFCNFGILAVEKGEKLLFIPAKDSGIVFITVAVGCSINNQYLPLDREGLVLSLLEYLN